MTHVQVPSIHLPRRHSLDTNDPASRYTHFVGSRFSRDCFHLLVMTAEQKATRRSTSSREAELATWLLDFGEYCDASEKSNEEETSSEAMADICARFEFGVYSDAYIRDDPPCRTSSSATLPRLPTRRSIAFADLVATTKSFGCLSVIIY
jgi:hypothetical protein